jgi:hypothetical protein
MRSTIHLLPGVERRDLGAAVPDHDVLNAAIAEGVSGVVVVGRDRTGGLYVASAAGNPDLVVGQLMRAVQHLASARIERDGAETGEESA